MCTALKAARQGRGWTKPVLIAQLLEAGARAGVRVAAPASLRVMLASWENGYRQPVASYQRLLCEVYDRSPAQLGFGSSAAGRGVGSEVDALAAVLYVAPLDTQTLATARRRPRHGSTPGVCWPIRSVPTAARSRPVTGRCGSRPRRGWTRTGLGLPTGWPRPPATPPSWDPVRRRPGCGRTGCTGAALFVTATEPRPPDPPPTS